MKTEEMTFEGLLRDLSNTTVKRRRDAMLAAHRAMAGHPSSLLCSQAEAARLLSTSRFTIWRMSRDNQLHPVTVRGCTRYRVAELEAIAAGQSAA